VHALLKFFFLNNVSKGNEDARFSRLFVVCVLRVLGKKIRNKTGEKMLLSSECDNFVFSLPLFCSRTNNNHAPFKQTTKKQRTVKLRRQ